MAETIISAISPAPLSSFSIVSIRLRESFPLTKFPKIQVSFVIGTLLDYASQGLHYDVRQV